MAGRYLLINLLFLILLTLHAIENTSLSSDERYSFSGRSELANKENKTQQPGESPAEMPDLSIPQEQLRQEAQTAEVPPPRSLEQRQRAGTAALSQTGNIPGGRSGPEVSTTQLDRTTAKRYANPPVYYQDLIPQGPGQNRNSPGDSNTSSASGSNIFGTRPLPFTVGSDNP